MNAALLTGTAAIGIWLWAQGTVSAGVVATALPLAWQIANVAGWVSWEVTGIFENIGVVQEGMQTIAVPHTGSDRPGARELEVTRGEIRFEDVTFSYGRRDGRAGARPPELHDPPRRARGPGRPLGRRQVDAGQPAAALLRAGAGPHPHRRAGHRRGDAGEPARGDRHGDAGHVAAAPLDRRQHPLRPPRRDRRAGAGGRAQGAGARIHRRPAGLDTAARATTRTSASAASSSRAGSASAWRSRAWC